MLTMWIVYDHPTDHPHEFIARKWLADRDGPYPTDETLVAADLDALRAQLPSWLTPLARDPNDDPKIVEVWL